MVEDRRARSYRRTRYSGRSERGCQDKDACRLRGPAQWNTDAGGNIVCDQGSPLSANQWTHAPSRRRRSPDQKPEGTESSEILRFWVADWLCTRGGRRKQDVRGTEYFDRRLIACISISDCDLDVACLVGRYRGSGQSMLLEDRGAGPSDAVLHHKIVAVVGQCESRGVVVKPRHNPADAAAFRSRLGAYLIESNFRNAYAVFCLRIRLVQILDVKTLEIDRLLLNRRRHRGNRRNRICARGNDDDDDDRKNGHANG